MAAPLPELPEVIYTSESTGQLCNTTIWDLHSGTNLHTFRGGISAHRTLTTISSDYLLTAELGKPLLHYWPLRRKDAHQQRIVCPGKVGALAVTPDSNFCIAAIAEKIHIWQISTGLLLAVLTSHYQPIHCLKVTSDGSHFISGGDDSAIYCWSLASVLSGSGPMKAEPRWCWTNHSLPITDVHVGNTGAKARVVSTSLDQSCRVWSVASGEELAVFMLEKPITSVCLNGGESFIYLGLVTGLIQKVNLFERPVRTDRHLVPDETTSYTGHTQEVTCLALSLDCSMLVSGSKDATVRIWHAPSKQCVRTFQHKGPITNILVQRLPAQLQSETFKPSIVIKPFDRHLRNPADDPFGEVHLIISGPQQVESDLDFCQKQAAKLFSYTRAERDFFLEQGDLSNKKVPEKADVEAVASSSLKEQLDQALIKNKMLYEYAAKLTLKYGSC